MIIRDAIRCRTSSQPASSSGICAGLISRRIETARTHRLAISVSELLDLNNNVEPRLPMDSPTGISEHGGERDREDAADLWEQTLPQPAFDLCATEHGAGDT